jgi:c-di-GMP-related signal transduction protein
MKSPNRLSRIVARQPIVDRRQRIYGYELLFRAGIAEFFSDDNGDVASRDVADNLFTSGPAVLTGGHLAFINCTRDFLLHEYATLLPKEQTAIEVLETIEPDSETLEALKRLKLSGYLVVLDDFVFSERFLPFIDLADIIKVDFLATSSSNRDALLRRLARRRVKLLAEKIETHAAFDEALRAGYSYFQGYFFCHPQIVEGTSIPASKIRYLDLLRVIAQPELDMHEISAIIRGDLSLVYKLLRLVNSAWFGLAGEVRSVDYALALLGENQVRKWAAVAALLSAAQDKPPELIRTSMVRARCCELLASMIGHGQDECQFFLTGLFSLMDALLGRPMNELLAQIALPRATRLALSGGDNLQRRACDLVKSYERADWPEVTRSAAALGVNDSTFFQIFLESERLTTAVLGEALESSARVRRLVN